MKLYLSIFILTFSVNALAILEFEDATSPELITSARALAMGNAYMSKVDDSWASFYNPAGLGTVRGLMFHLGNVHAELNNGFLNVAANGGFTDSIGNYSKALTATGMRSLLANKPGNTTHARIQVFPNITFRGVTLGYLYAKQNRARLSSASSDLELAERFDSGPVLSLNLSLFGGVFKLGASAVYLTREQLQKDFAANQPVNISKGVDYKKGSMTLVTAGTRITLPIFLLPTISVVSRNSSSAEWLKPGFSGVPDQIPSTIDASASITPYLGRTSRLHIEVARRDLGDKYENVPAARKLQAGVEFDWVRKYFLRFGYGDGWGSFGIGVRNNSFMFDLTSYAIEGSAEEVKTEEDRRSILSISSGF